MCLNEDITFDWSDYVQLFHELPQASGGVDRKQRGSKDDTYAHTSTRRSDTKEDAKGSSGVDGDRKLKIRPSSEDDTEDQPRPKQDGPFTVIPLLYRYLLRKHGDEIIKIETQCNVTIQQRSIKLIQILKWWPLLVITNKCLLKNLSRQRMTSSPSISRSIVSRNKYCLQEYLINISIKSFPGYRQTSPMY